MNDSLDELSTANEYQKVIEEELKTSNEALNEMNKSLGNIVNEKTLEHSMYLNAIDKHICSVVLSSDFTILDINEPMLHMCGLNEEDVLQKSFENILHKQTESFHELESIYKNLKNGNNWQGEIACVGNKNTESYFDLFLKPVFNHSNELKYYLGLATPITDKKRLFIERAKNLELIENLAFKTAHELRGPIANILGLIQVIDCESTVTEEEIKNVSAHFKLSATRLDTVMKEFMDYLQAHKV